MDNNSHHSDINKITISASETILSAIKKMDGIGKKLLIIFHEDKFVGLLSIGDIQRAIIQNKSLQLPVRDILRENIKVCTTSDSFDVVKQKMVQYKTECMPILDKNGELAEVYFWEDVFALEHKRISSKLNLPVVIMAGGKGTRLQPLTNVIPKPLIPIGNKTTVEHIMDRFVEVGCSNFFMSVNYKAETIKHYFSQLKNQSYSIQYFEEDKPLGTAGSLFLLKGKINITFFVSNCDIIIDTDYADILHYHKQNKNELTIVSALKHYPIPYGTIETGENGLLTKLKEKPELTFQINSGMYILEPHLLDEIPENEFFHITHLIENIQNRNGRVGVFPVSESSWKDIGDIDLFKKYNNF